MMITNDFVRSTLFFCRYGPRWADRRRQAVEQLVTQICYRAADLAYLLKQEGTTLSRYSRHLRREPDMEYYEGYFDEEE